MSEDAAEELSEDIAEDLSVDAAEELSETDAEEVMGGDDLAGDETLAACVKHFAGYGAPDGGRDYNTVQLTERTFHSS